MIGSCGPHEGVAILGPPGAGRWTLTDSGGSPSGAIDATRRPSTVERAHSAVLSPEASTFDMFAGSSGASPRAAAVADAAYPDPPPLGASEALSVSGGLRAKFRPFAVVAPHAVATVGVPPNASKVGVESPGATVGATRPAATRSTTDYLGGPTSGGGGGGTSAVERAGQLLDYGHRLGATAVRASLRALDAHDRRLSNRSDFEKEAEVAIKAATGALGVASRAAYDARMQGGSHAEEQIEEAAARAKRTRDRQLGGSLYKQGLRDLDVERREAERERTRSEERIRRESQFRRPRDERTAHLRAAEADAARSDDTRARELRLERLEQSALSNSLILRDEQENARLKALEAAKGKRSAELVGILKRQAAREARAKKEHASRKRRWDASSELRARLQREAQNGSASARRRLDRMDAREEADEGARRAYLEAKKARHERDPRDPTEPGLNVPDEVDELADLEARKLMREENAVKRGSAGDPCAACARPATCPPSRDWVCTPPVAPPPPIPTPPPPPGAPGGDAAGSGDAARGFDESGPLPVVSPPPPPPPGTVPSASPGGSSAPTQQEGEDICAFYARLLAWARENPAQGVTVVRPKGCLEAPVVVPEHTQPGPSPIVPTHRSMLRPTQGQGEDICDFYRRLRAWAKENPSPNATIWVPRRCADETTRSPAHAPPPTPPAPPPPPSRVTTPSEDRGHRPDPCLTQFERAKSIAARWRDLRRRLQNSLELALPLKGSGIALLKRAVTDMIGWGKNPSPFSANGRLHRLEEISDKLAELMMSDSEDKPNPCDFGEELDQLDAAGGDTEPWVDLYAAIVGAEVKIDAMRQIRKSNLYLTSKLEASLRIQDVYERAVAPLWKVFKKWNAKEVKRTDMRADPVDEFLGDSFEAEAEYHAALARADPSDQEYIDSIESEVVDAIIGILLGGLPAVGKNALLAVLKKAAKGRAERQILWRAERAAARAGEATVEGLSAEIAETAGAKAAGAAARTVGGRALQALDRIGKEFAEAEARKRGWEKLAENVSFRSSEGKRTVVDLVFRTADRKIVYVEAKMTRRVGRLTIGGPADLAEGLTRNQRSLLRELERGSLAPVGTKAASIESAIGKLGQALGEASRVEVWEFPLRPPQR